MTMPSSFATARQVFAIVYDHQQQGVMQRQLKSVEHGRLVFHDMLRNHEFEPYDHEFVIYEGSEEVERLLINKEPAF
jgi:hypothetical protein